MKIKWRAILSNGQECIQEEGEWKTESNQRLPWVRLTEFAAQNNLYLTSLSLEVDGNLIHMPSGIKGTAPDFYSLSYRLEIDDLMSSNRREKHFVDLAAHFDDLAVHLIQEINGDSWITVTKGDIPMAPSPRRI